MLRPTIAALLCVLSFGNHSRSVTHASSFASHPAPKGRPSGRIVDPSKPPSLCSRLHTPAYHLQQNALTIDKTHLYIIEDDFLYTIPRTNLDTSANVLYLYHRQDDSLTSAKMGDPILGKPWYELEKFAIPIEADLKKYRARYAAKNAQHTLKRFHYLVTDTAETDEETPIGGKYGLLKSYVFETRETDGFEEEYLVGRKGDKEAMLFDNVRDCSKADGPALCHRHAPFIAVTDGDSTVNGFMFYYDLIGAQTTGQPARILLGPLKGAPYRGCQRREEHGGGWINFPAANSSHPFGVYLQTVGTDRSRIRLLTVQDTDSRAGKRTDDYFLHLPFGIILKGKVYLFSRAAHRVYWFNLDQFREGFYTSSQGTINQVKSKDFKEFFICEPGQTIVPDSQLEREPSQAEYVHRVVNWTDSKPTVGPALPLRTLLILLMVSLLSTLFLCLLCFRMRTYAYRQKRKRIIAAAAVARKVTLKKSNNSNKSLSELDSSLSSSSDSSVAHSSEATSDSDSDGGTEMVKVGDSKSKKRKTAPRKPA